MVLSENMEFPTMIPVGMKPSTYSWDIYKKTESMVHIGLRVRGGIAISWQSPPKTGKTDRKCLSLRNIQVLLKNRIMFKRFSICYILFMFYLTGISAQEDRWTGNATNLSKGNLRVNSSGRYLEYTDGTPFLYIGDTAWELISRLNDKETEQYLENRREKGFTVIQTVILDELDDMNVSSNGGPKLIDGNIDKPAPDYFTHVDKVISLAAVKGLYIALLPTWGDKVDKQWGKGPEIFTPENAYKYGKWLGERYMNAPNLIWVIGGDRSGDGKNFAIWNALATGIKSVDKTI